MTKTSHQQTQAPVTGGDLVTKEFAETNYTAYPPSHLEGLGLTWLSAAAIIILPGTCRDRVDSANIVMPSPSAVVILSSSGVNGLDTGTEASDTWYAVYVIADSTGSNPTEGLFSLSFTSPTLPAGYDVFRRVGAVRNDGSSNIENFLEVSPGRRREIVRDLRVIVLNGGNVTTWTSIDCSAAAPPSASHLSFLHGFLNNDTAAREVRFRHPSVTEAQLIYAPGFVSAQRALHALFRYPCSATQTIEYKMDSGNSSIHNLDLYVNGWVDEL